jgi:hypothetical protein
MNRGSLDELNISLLKKSALTKYIDDSCDGCDDEYEFNENEYIYDQIGYAEFIVNLTKLVYKYNGEVIFLNRCIYSPAVLRPKFKNFEKVLEASHVEGSMTKKNYYAIAELLGYPKTPNFYKKKYGMVISLNFTNEKTKECKTIQLLGFKIKSSTPVNMDNQIEDIKTSILPLRIMFNKANWSLQNIDYIRNWFTKDDNGHSLVKKKIIKTF